MPGHERVVTPAALDFLTELHRRFEDRRQECLDRRRQFQKAVDAGLSLGFREDTEEIRQGDWKVAPVPEALQDRRVEITGPVDRKMMINALNSGARVFMADFEDSHSPTWHGTIAGQINVQDAVRGELTYTDTRKRYAVGDDPALLVVRVRGLHLPEKHVIIDDVPVSGALFDFAMTYFHNARLMDRHGTGPYFYIPKLESMEEARLWDDVFTFAEDRLGLPHGTTKATVLIETLPAALQMDEILYALRDHIVGLNAGRWDYIFSCIKTFQQDAPRVLPDRSQVTMEAPFMHAYSELLVQTCHRRGAFAMGGMSAFIPDRNDADRNRRALTAVRQDKLREAGAGFDGTWVAHPGLISIAYRAFDEVLQGRRNQLHRLRDDVEVDPDDLLDLRIPDGKRTRAGLRHNVDVGIRYLDSWLAGRGAAAIHGLMEDAATAEISRSQVWQWLRHDATVDGGPLTRPQVQETIADVARRLIERSEDVDRTGLAARIFEEAVMARRLPEFLTLLAYDHLEDAP